MINLFSKTDDFTNTYKFINKNTLVYKHDEFMNKKRIML